jgi:hypothetical protein
LIRSTPYPELHQAPLYSAGHRSRPAVLPEGVRAACFAKRAGAADGFAADYFLLGLNLMLLWLAAWLTYRLGRRLFEPRVGWVAALALMLSMPLWRQTVAVNGTAAPDGAGPGRLPPLVGTGAGPRAGAAFRPGSGRRRSAWVCGLLFLTEYSAGALVLVAFGYVAWRFPAHRRWPALGLVALLFAVVTGPWMVRNVALTGHPVALAAQNVALKAGDSTAEPARVTATLSAEGPDIDLNKLGNKTLTALQETVTSRIWAGGAMWFAAFFVTGWLYASARPPVDRMRWVFTSRWGCWFWPRPCAIPGPASACPSIIWRPS